MRERSDKKYRFHENESLPIAFVFDPEHLLAAGDDRAAEAFAGFLPRARNTASSQRQIGLMPAWRQLSRTMRSQQFLRVGSDQLNEFTRYRTLSPAIMLTRLMRLPVVPEVTFARAKIRASDR